MNTSLWSLPTTRNGISIFPNLKTHNQDQLQASPALTTPLPEDLHHICRFPFLTFPVCSHLRWTLPTCSSLHPTTKLPGHCPPAQHLCLPYFHLQRTCPHALMDIMSVNVLPPSVHSETIPVPLSLPGMIYSPFPADSGYTSPLSGLSLPSLSQL